MFKYRLVVVAGLLGCLSACVTEGRDFRSDISWIQPNKTSMQDVKLLLRDPYSVGNSSGKPTWTYGFYRYRLVGASHQKELKFYWNPDGTVGNYSFSSSFPDDTTRGHVGTPAPVAPAPGVAPGANVHPEY
jgi:hypothetical protein